MWARVLILFFMRVVELRTIGVIGIWSVSTIIQWVIISGSVSIIVVISHYSDVFDIFIDKIKFINIKSV